MKLECQPTELEHAHYKLGSCLRFVITRPVWCKGCLQKLIPHHHSVFIPRNNEEGSISRCSLLIDARRIRGPSVQLSPCRVSIQTCLVGLVTHGWLRTITMNDRNNVGHLSPPWADTTSRVSHYVSEQITPPDWSTNSIAKTRHSVVTLLSQTETEQRSIFPGLPPST